MELSVLQRRTLSDIPSASGIEVVGNSLYVIGDDSPFLFRLDENFEVKEKIPICDIPASSEGKIPKHQKSDLEAMASFTENGINTLLLFGSGSKSPQRDVLLQIDISKPASIKKYSLTKFYNSLCTDAKIARTDLNLEAAAVVEKEFFLFNRGKNKIFKLNLQEFLSHIETNTPFPICEIFSVTLPSLNGIEAGFSGAAVSPDSKQIIFTASVENTPNPIDDGEILGSFAGGFSLDELQNAFTPECVPIKDEKGNVLKIKVESIAIQKVISGNTFRLLLVTDNDASSSELIEAELRFT